MSAPKNPAGYRLGIVNPLTLVGNEVSAVLRERSFPYAKLVLLDSTGQATGALTEVGDEPAVVTAISDDELEDLDLVFFCGPAEGNREWIEHHAEDNFVAIDLSQPTSAAEGKLAVADLNLESVSDADRLLVSPHPITVPLALILHQIATVSPIESCVASVVQPASHFDQAGVEELAAQTISVLNVQTIPQTVFDRRLAFNLYPAPEHHEDFVVAQVRALTSPSLGLALSITQGTIFHGHTLVLFVKTTEAVDVERIREALKASRAIDFAEGDQEFSTSDAAGRDEVLIADVRADAGGFWIWAVCDNLRRGAALNAVLVAEKLLSETAVN